MRKLARGVALLALPLAATAQDAGDSPCLDRIDPAEMKPVPVSLVLGVSDSITTIGPHAQSFTWALADALRARLGIGEGDLRETALGWRELYGQMRVFVRPNGSFWWRWEESEPGGPRHGYTLMDSALTTISAARPLFFPVGAARGDSQSFVIDYQWPRLTREGRIEPLRTRFAIPLFLVRRPWEEPVAVARMPRPEYPRYPRANNIQATIILRAVIDTTGRVDPATLRDYWPPEITRPRGDRARDYDDFVRSGKEALLRARFRPALVGGCPIRQFIQQPLNFHLIR